MPGRRFAQGVLWRVFPWDPAAPDGAPFSARSVAAAHHQMYGRFDQGGRPLVLYLAETPAHAAAEVLRGVLRSPERDRALLHRISERDLVQNGHPRALISIRMPPEMARCFPDLSDGSSLKRFGVRADELSSNLSTITQAAARRIYQHPARVPGFAWSSRFGGDWHVVLLFLDRAPLADLEFGVPEILLLGDAAVIEAARVLHAEISTPG